VSPPRPHWHIHYGPGFMEPTDGECQTCVALRDPERSEFVRGVISGLMAAFAVAENSPMLQEAPPWLWKSRGRLLAEQIAQVRPETVELFIHPKERP